MAIAGADCVQPAGSHRPQGESVRTSLATAISLPGHTWSAAKVRVNLAAAILAFLCLAVWGISLSRSLFDPLWIDQALFHYHAERVIAGQRLYQDLYTLNPPLIVGVHWLSVVAFGRSELAFRAFDAGWQLLTLMVLAKLARRDDRGWQVGGLAAVVYMMSYYGFGYTDTATPEGFAVLPLLLAVHAMACQSSDGRRRFCSRFLAGVMGFLVFGFKLPLGMCFGVLWLMALWDAWRERRIGWRALIGVGGLTSGFLFAAVVAVVLLMRLGWWEGYVPILLGREFPIGLVHGPWQMIELLPWMTVASVLIAAALLWGALLSPVGREGVRDGRLPFLAWARSWLVGLIVFGLLLTLVFWSGWHSLFVRVMGILVPAIGAALVRDWSGRSPIWRMVMLSGCASLGALFLQGNFNTYQVHPVLACASYLLACEVVDGLKRFTADPQSARVWTAVCLAGIAHLAVCHWWRKMTKVTSAPYVLADATLYDHYARVTANRDNVPADRTIRRVADRIRARASPDEAMACLFADPRVYYLADRPAVHKIVWVCDDNRHRHPEMLSVICGRRPKVLLARIPPAARGQNDVQIVASAVFDHAESVFGPPARPLRQFYHVAEIIDDVCILEPLPGAALPQVRRGW